MTFTLNDPIAALIYEIQIFLPQNYASFEWYYLMVSNINRYSYVNNIQKLHLKCLKIFKNTDTKKSLHIELHCN